MPGTRDEIIVPLDGSTNAERAIPVAVVLARALGCDLTLVHVLHDHGPERERTRAAQLFADYGERLAREAGAGNLPHRVTVEAGNPPEIILRAAADARCIVIGSHGRGGLHASLIGSVADRVIRGAEVPVVVVPLGGPNEIGSGPVLIALDGSEAAERGLVAGRALAAALGRRVALVRAYSVPAPVGIEFVPYSNDLPALLKEGAEEYLGEVAKEGEQQFCLFATPGEAIEAAAEDSDASIVVMTSHGKNLARRVTIGSTTEHVMHSLRRPLLIVPARVTQAGRREDMAEARV